MLRPLPASCALLKDLSAGLLHPFTTQVTPFSTFPNLLTRHSTLSIYNIPARSCRCSTSLGQPWTPHFSRWEEGFRGSVLLRPGGRLLVSPSPSSQLSPTGTEARHGNPSRGSWSLPLVSSTSLTEPSRGRRGG